MNRTLNGRRRLLLVEDDDGDVLLARESLGGLSTPIDLEVVSDGAAALAFLRRNGAEPDGRRPDLILLDLNLPGMSGWEVLRAIKGDVQLHAIPVVVLTTSKSENDIRAAYDLGANCYITKPPGLKEYESAIQRLGDFWLNVARVPEPVLRESPARRTHT